MIYGIGTDIIEVERIKDAIQKYGPRFLNRIYTKVEQEYCESFNENKFLHYAARFAAKESFSKAIGTGITQGFKFNEIGVVNQSNGKPNIVLYGGLLQKWGEYKIQVSLSHTQTNAVAFITIEKD
ncbi:MAG: holo-ACP synthase [Candidatus Kapabacteria bacterium]|nr:holo-ACP synthase [Candidatus Kapabacteria bacterium]